MQLNIASTAKSNPIVLKMFDEIRDRHIDIEAIVEKELQDILPQYRRYYSKCV